jgi:hypothetical protein
MSWAQSLALIVSLALFEGQSSSDWKPSREQVEFVEKQIVLPQEAPASIAHFNRYYSGITDNGKRLIYAEFVYINLLGPNRPGDNAGHIYIVTEQELPVIVDGGCGVITFYYDLHRTYTPSLVCNANASDNAP